MPGEGIREPSNSSVARARAAEITAGLCPGFEPSVRELAVLYGEDLSDEIVLDELASYFAAVLSASLDEPIEEVCVALERLSEEPSVGGVGAVRDHVLDPLPPPLVSRAREYLGPRALAAAEDLE